MGETYQGQPDLPHPVHHCLRHDHGGPHDGRAPQHCHRHRHDPHRRPNLLHLHLLEEQTSVGQKTAADYHRAHSEVIDCRAKRLMGPHINVWIYL